MTTILRRNLTGMLLGGVHRFWVPASQPHIYNAIILKKEAATYVTRVTPQGESSESTQSSSSSSDDIFNKHSNSDKTERSTYVEEEVAKFRYMSDSWWDINGDCKPLHSLNRLRVSLMREGLVQCGTAKMEYISGPQPLTGLKILDVGSGGGILCEPLARLGAKVVGLDAAEENVNVAQLHAEQDPRVQHNVQYVCGTVEEHAEVTKDQYDAVVASEVLEHVNHPDLFIQTCAQIVKPGGSIFLTTLNKTVGAWVGAVAIAEYALHLLPPGTHDWNKFVPRQELLFILEKNGFVTRMVHGMAYNPLNNEWYWIPNTAINYAVHAIKES
ncbi:hypothetical protein Pmani_018475 [Petrolisthes manimaculis]|uniref:Ubiquinone biosynthesis O-methyltransferase, mitochondrial n=1 Tax=Petrolisthes manimaculis TaxID=1843537 RepID=A0AAE1U6N4_9EUCA|nr:hypothetical protein Pmani_018475 [Petrolisthes manimaculis]